MRRFFVILLVVLLPLRGWAAEGMAIQMAAESVTSATQIATKALMSSMPENCQMMGMMANEQNASDHDGKPACGCQSCDLCMPIAEPFQATTRAPALPPTLQLGFRATSYVDADLVSDIKPPISRL